MDYGPSSEYDKSNNNKDPTTRRRSRNVTPPPLQHTPSPFDTPPNDHRTPSPFELLSGVKGALEGKLGRRESPDNLIARNILRGSPITAGRVTSGAQELKWKQTKDTIAAHLKDKLSKEPTPNNGTKLDEETFQDKQEAVKQALDARSPRVDLVKRGLIVESEETDPESDSNTPILPRVNRRRSVPASGLPTIVIPQSPVSTPSHSPAMSPFANVRGRKRASSLILPGSRSTTPVPHDEDDSANTSHVRVTRNYTHLLSTDVRSLAHGFVNLQMSQNGMMIQRLDGEVGIPYICCTGGYIWVGYKGGTVLAFESLCMEPNEELRQDPVSSHSYIRALIAVGTHVWCGHASGEIHIWDGADGEHLNTINAHPGVGVSALFYAERSGQVWSGGGDGKVFVWSATGKHSVRRMGQSHKGAVRIISQIGNYIWTISDSAAGAFLWEADTAQEPSIHPNGNTSLPNGKPSRSSPIPFAGRTSTPPRRIKETHRDVEEVPASVVHLGSGILCILGVPHHESSATMMWAGTDQGPIRVIDPESKDVVRTLTGHISQVNTLVLVGAHVWSASNDKSVRIWGAKNMDSLRVISDAHASAIYSLCVSGSHVWSGSTDRSIRVWLAAGSHDLLGSFLDSALQGIYDLESRQRKGEEKLAQSEAHAKQSAEEIASLRIKLKTQAGEALNAKHEMELLAQEVASVDQWQRKMQALKAVYHSDKSVLKDKLAKAHDFIEHQDSEMYDMREKLREADASLYRLQSDRNGIEAEARELALLLQKVEADSMDYISKLAHMERKEKEDVEARKRLEIKLWESQETEARLRQSVLLLENKFAKSTKSSSRPNSGLSGKLPDFRRRSSTIGYGETANLSVPLNADLEAINELGMMALSRPHIPKLQLGIDTKAVPKIPATIDESDTVRMGDTDESETTTGGRYTIREEGEGETERDGEEAGELGDEIVPGIEEVDVEMTDVTVSLVDVLGMVKYKGERTTALQERIQTLSNRLQKLHHERHIQQLQQLHQQQMEQREAEIAGSTTGSGLGWWSLVFVFFVGLLGVLLLFIRKNVYFSSLHPS